MKEQTQKKLKVLASAAKYDVSCASSGVKRSGSKDKLGNAAPMGICHSFTEDGRCVSLLKVMMTNHCEFDCAYCVNRKTNDIQRTTLSPSEIIEITMEFYRRNFIEGLFLSSGIIKSADYTMERLIRVAKELRITHGYNGYIHLKTIPSASRELIFQAGLYADRLSANMEISNDEMLKQLAPGKNHEQILKPINQITQGILENKSLGRTNKNIRKFAPAGQSTQLIVGATSDTDNSILKISASLYGGNKLKRVYYSGYIPVNTYDTRLPALSAPPLIRENRLYQADWLLRFYQFTVDELVNDISPNLDLDVDPKLGYALRHPEVFPIDVNTADYEMLLRIPGVGILSAQKIIRARKYGKLGFHQLQKIGVVMKKAKYFVSTRELNMRTINELNPGRVKADLMSKTVAKRRADEAQYKIQFNTAPEISN